jgi:hypothetical protein
VCLYLYPPIVARERPDKNVTTAMNTYTHNRIIVGRNVFYAVRVVKKGSRWLHLPRTPCFCCRLQSSTLNLKAVYSPKVVELLPDYTASHPRKYLCSVTHARASNPKWGTSVVNWVNIKALIITMRLILVFVSAISNVTQHQTKQGISAIIDDVIGSSMTSWGRCFVSVLTNANGQQTVAEFHIKSI